MTRRCWGRALSATGPDGTVYTLTVPDGALTTETTVTMTPWKSASGTGIAGGRLFGVRLTPSGTEFLLPVTLRINAPGPDALPAVTSTRESGTSYGYPAALETDKLVLQLTHFSEVYGAQGEGTSIKIDDPATLNPRQALAAEMERLLREERNRQLNGEDPDPTLLDKIEQLMTAYYNNVVAPRLAGIRVSCAQAEAHTGHVVGFARQAALLGIMGCPAAGHPRRCDAPAPRTVSRKPSSRASTWTTPRSCAGSSATGGRWSCSAARCPTRLPSTRCGTARTCWAGL